MRKIEVPTDSIPEFELGDMAADIQRRREEREARQRVEEAQKQREKAMREETTHSAEEGVAEGHVRTHKSNTEMNICTEGGAPASIVLITSKSFAFEVCWSVGLYVCLFVWLLARSRP